MKAHNEAKREHVSRAPCGKHPMQVEKRERQEVERLKLDVGQVGEVIWSKAKDESGDVRRAFVGHERPNELMHGQRRRDQRAHEQDVVTEHEIVRERVERPQEHRLQQQVVGIGQRLGRREVDVGVEHAAVHQPERMGGQRLQIPPERP